LIPPQLDTAFALLRAAGSNTMAVFPSRKFRSSAKANTIASRYRAALGKHPFALFGLPFIATMVAGSFFLTPATAIRYEKHDRKVQRLSKEEELGIGKAGRKVDMKEEYYVSFPVEEEAAVMDLEFRASVDKPRHLLIYTCTETCSERPGRLGTKACQETSKRA
jgi:cytochrome c oxidase assembly protein subunit 16